MPIDITMPALSPTMSEGTLARWIKKEGEPVKPGDVLLEIETDKATMEVEAIDEGVLGKILVDDGTEGVKVGAVIGSLLVDGESADDAKAPAAKPAKAEPAQSNVSSKEAAPPASTSPSAAAAEEARDAQAAQPSGDASPRNKPASSGNTGSERIFASPLARRIAANQGIDLGSVTGTGPHGRIVKADVEATAKSPKAAPAPATPAQSKTAPDSAPSVGPAKKQGKDEIQGLAGGIDYELTPHTNMRRAIARRLTESKQTVPHFYLTVDCELDELLKIRTSLNEANKDIRLSVNDFIIRAAAIALKKVPAANASYSDEGTMQWKSIDISVAVAIDDGLITPIIENADQKGLGQISSEMKDLGARAKAGKLKLNEFQGGTFSISNLGMFGIKEFAAVINPPQGCILAVGAGEQRAVVKEGALAIATVMSCTLSVDHRVVDGAIGAEYLRAFKRLIEAPLSMLL